MRRRDARPRGTGRRAASLSTATVRLLRTTPRQEGQQDESTPLQGVSDAIRVTHVNSCGAHPDGQHQNGPGGVAPRTKPLRPETPRHHGNFHPRPVDGYDER
jgi:hypothetical protein